jgi:hypothetical protein
MPLKLGSKKISWWWVAGGGALGVGGIWYYRRQEAAAGGSSPAAGSSSAIDPVTGLPASEDNTDDPVTGMTYLAEAQQYGSVAAAEAAYQNGGAESSYLGSGESGYPLDSGSPTGYYTTSPATPGPGTYTTDAQWAQAVTAGLTEVGYSSQDIAAALGLYFAGHPLTSGADGVSYLQIMQAALAEFGPPPVGSYALIAPPSSGGGNPGSGGTTGKTTVTVPSVTGQHAAAAVAVLQEAGLSPHLNRQTPHGKVGTIDSQTPGAGSKVAKGTRVDLDNKIS